MKNLKIITALLFTAAMTHCYAGTGAARDETYFILLLIAVLLFVFVVLFAIDMAGRMIRRRKVKRLNDAEMHITE